MKIRTLGIVCLLSLCGVVVGEGTRSSEFTPSRISVELQFIDAAGRTLAVPPAVGERSFVRVAVIPRERGVGRVPIAIAFENEIEPESVGGLRAATERRPYTENETIVVDYGEAVFETTAQAEWIVPVVVRRAGQSTIRVRAESASEGRTAEALLHVTFGDRVSSWGFTLPPHEIVEPPHTLDGGGFISCPGGSGVFGHAKYVDPNGSKRPVQHALAKLFYTTEDDEPQEMFVAETETDSSGQFYFCDAGGGKLTVRVYAEYLTKENRGYRVNKVGQADTLFMTTCNVCQLPGNEMVDVGNIYPDPDTDNAGFHVFDVARQAFDEIASDDCWGFHPAQCRQIAFQWDPNNDTAFFNFDANNPKNDFISIGGSMATYPDAIVHEIAHALKYRLYDDVGYSDPNCIAMHALHQKTSQQCAFEEGFAAWLPTWVFGKENHQQQGKTWSLEKPSWKWKDNYDQIWKHGDMVEGRIAGTLRDLVDTVNSSDNPGLTPWDQIDVGGERKRVLKSMEVYTPTTLEEFVTGLYNWMADLDEYNSPSKKEELRTNLLAACFQNTIDYDFRNPLGLAALKYPSPFTGDNDIFGLEVPHAYSFFPGYGWTLVSVATTTKKRLALFKDIQLIDQVGDNVDTCHPAGPGCDDAAFIALQSWEATPDLHYPEVRGDHKVEATAKPYTIELSKGLNTQPGSKSFPNDDKLFRIIDLGGFTNNDLASVLVEPLDHQLVSIALLPSAPEVVDSLDPNIFWSRAIEADTRPKISFPPDVPSGNARALVIRSQTPGAVAVHLDQIPPNSFTPKLGFYQGNTYADPYPEFDNAVPWAHPKTNTGYVRYLWTMTPDWSQVPWKSVSTQLTYVDEPSGVVSTSRLRPAHGNEFKVTLNEAAPGSTKPLCMQVMSEAGLVTQGCATVQFPVGQPKYYFSDTKKN